jgi:hypothetical protein
LYSSNYDRNRKHLFFYCRYVSEFIICLGGSREVAFYVFNKILVFLKKELYISKVSHSTSILSTLQSSFKFLEFNIKQESLFQVENKLKDNVRIQFLENRLHNLDKIKKIVICIEDRELRQLKRKLKKALILSLVNRKQDKVSSSVLQALGSLVSFLGLKNSLHPFFSKSILSFI